MKDNGGSKKGCTKGSLGDASVADLDRGYSDAEPKSQKLHDAASTMPFESPEGGFVGRPDGWER